MARAEDHVRRDPTPGSGRTPPSEATRLYAAYFVLQAAVGVALWMAYAASPTVRSWVGLIPARPVVTRAFAYPDLAVIVVGSALSAQALASGARRAVPLTAFTAGAVLYPTLYLVGWVATTSHTGTSTLAIMIPPALLTSWISWQVWRGSERHGPA